MRGLTDPKVSTPQFVRLFSVEIILSDHLQYKKGLFGKDRQRAHQSATVKY